MAVYFIRCGDGGLVKIGYAVNPNRRLTLLQTGNPERLTLMRVADGDRSTEAALHKHFAAQRVTGEWFAFSEQMLTIGIDAPGATPLPKRPKLVFHPLVEAAIKQGKYSPTMLRNWRERGVPYKVCNQAYYLGVESGAIAAVGEVNVQMLRRPIPAEPRSAA